MDISSQPGALSLEQQFKLQVLRDEVKELTLEQAQGYVVEMMRQMMAKDNLTKHLLKDDLAKRCNSALKPNDQA